MLVLVEVLGDGLARHARGLRRVVLDLDVALLGDAEDLRQPHELVDQGNDVVLGQRAYVEVGLLLQARVELVAADTREVVALGIEEQLVEQRLGVVNARRLTGTLLLEQLDQGALFGTCRLGVGLDRVADVQRVLEQAQDLLIGGVAHRTQQHRHRQLALAVDAHVNLALLVDLQLQPRSTRRHQVGDEDLLLAVLRFHQVRARGAHQLGDDHALGAVDHERAALGHPRKVAHEHRLLADLAGLAVDERDRHRQRAGVREVLLAALVQRRNGLIERELAELHGEVAGVVLNRRDVVDCLAQTTGLWVGQPRKRAALDVNQVGDVNGLLQAREASARPESIYSSQEMTPSEGDTRAEEGAEARLRKIAQAIPTLKGRQHSRTPSFEKFAYVARPRRFGRLRLSASGAHFTGKRADLLGVGKDVRTVRGGVGVACSLDASAAVARDRRLDAVSPEGNRLCRRQRHRRDPAGSACRRRRGQRPGMDLVSMGTRPIPDHHAPAEHAQETVDLVRGSKTGPRRRYCQSARYRAA